ncbi:uncharacterized protein [Argopecten irradians]|uniref:uncharacterized protein n=1 Tax=Argopecten irradians TaxID=31199 RepID=UPI003721CDAE
MQWRDNQAIERVILTFSSLQNLNLEEGIYSDFGGINSVSVYMVVAFVNTSMGMTGETQPFYTNMTSNGNVIGNTSIDLEKPAMNYYENFIVVTSVKTNITASQTIWIYCSLNGTYFYRKSLEWTANRHDFRFPLVINHFYFVADACVRTCITALYLPLSHYLTVVKDKENSLLKNVGEYLML